MDVEVLEAVEGWECLVESVQPGIVGEASGIVCEMVFYAGAVKGQACTVDGGTDLALNVSESVADVSGSA